MARTPKWLRINRRVNDYPHHQKAAHRRWRWLDRYIKVRWIPPGPRSFYISIPLDLSSERL